MLHYLWVSRDIEVKNILVSILRTLLSIKALFFHIHSRMFSDFFQYQLGSGVHTNTTVNPDCSGFTGCICKAFIPSASIPSESEICRKHQQSAEVRVQVLSQRLSEEIPACFSVHRFPRHVYRTPDSAFSRSVWL